MKAGFILATPARGLQGSRKRKPIKHFPAAIPRNGGGSKRGAREHRLAAFRAQSRASSK